MNVAKEKLPSRTNAPVSSEEILPTVIHNKKPSTRKKVTKINNKLKCIKTNPRTYASHQPLPIRNRNFPFSDFKFKQPKKLQNTSHINLKKSFFGNESIGSITKKLVQDPSDNSPLNQTCVSFNPKMTSTPMISPPQQINNEAKQVSSKDKPRIQASSLYPQIILEEPAESNCNRKNSKDEFENDFFDATTFVSFFELRNSEPKVLEQSFIQAFDGKKDISEYSVLKALSFPSPNRNTILKTLSPLRSPFQHPRNQQRKRSAKESFYAEFLSENQNASQSQRGKQNGFLSMEKVLMEENVESTRYTPLFETRNNRWSTPNCKSSDIFDTSIDFTSYFNSPKISDRQQIIFDDEMLPKSNMCDQPEQILNSPKIHYEELLRIDDGHRFSKDHLRTPLPKPRMRNNHLPESEHFDYTSRQIHSHVNLKAQNPSHFNRNSNNFSTKRTNISDMEESFPRIKWEPRYFGSEPDPNVSIGTYHQEVVQRAEKVIRSVEKDLMQSPTFKYSPRKVF